MLTANSILLGIVALICLAGGLNVLLKGAMPFLPKETPPQLVLDDLVRFLGGIYFSAGFLFGYAAFNVADIGNIIYFLALMVVCSGLGRLFSRIKVGSAGKYFDFIMIIEVVLGLSIIALKWLGK